MTTYLTDRTAYVEVQGFYSTIRTMPNCSVIQGSKLSSKLYTIYMLDLTKADQVMMNPERYREIVNKELVETNEP